MTKAVIGSGRFQWNSGAWFGGSLGGIAWMAIASLCLLVNDQPTVALAPAAGFTAGLVACVALWNRRTHIAPFKALMMQCGLIALLTPIILYTIHVSSPALTGMKWPNSPWSLFANALIVPGLMLWFFLLERTADKHSINC